jgi:NAD(P)-dependent dehydrogenase (short-subunit alcohol dehydrogenase family)
VSQRIVITAGASGIGRAIAERFLADGAEVAICDVDADAVADFAGAYPGAPSPTSST